jgi:hypothetical protein
LKDDRCPSPLDVEERQLLSGSDPKAVLPLSADIVEKVDF